jgi:hypothetical protein
MESQIVRDENGRWLSGGASPNPGGRPKGAIQRIRRVCQEAAETIACELIEIALDPTVRPRDRISAAALVLDRGLGKVSTLTTEENEEPEDLTTKVLKVLASQSKARIEAGIRNRSLEALAPGSVRTEPELLNSQAKN